MCHPRSVLQVPQSDAVPIISAIQYLRPEMSSHFDSSVALSFQELSLSLFLRRFFPYFGMSDAVSTLYRLVQEQSSAVTYHRDAMQDQDNLWVVHALMTRRCSSFLFLPQILRPLFACYSTAPTVLNNNGTGTQSNIGFFAGTGRAKRVKQAKQYAAKAVLSQLSCLGMVSTFFVLRTSILMLSCVGLGRYSATVSSGILPTNARDRTQYLLDRHNNQVVFKGQSTGENLPQRYRIALFGEFASISITMLHHLKSHIPVGGNTVPVAVSDWLIRRDAIKQVLQKACVELGYLSRSADDLKYNLIVEGAEENADEIRNGLGREDVGEFREGTPFTPGPLHMQRNTPSSAAVVGERPSEGTLSLHPCVDKMR